MMKNQFVLCIEHYNEKREKTNNFVYADELGIALVNQGLFRQGLLNDGYIPSIGEWNFSKYINTGKWEYTKSRRKVGETSFVTYDLLNNRLWLSGRWIEHTPEQNEAFLVRWDFPTNTGE